MVFAGKVEGIEKLAVPVGPRPMLYDRRVRLRVIEQFTGQTAAEVDIFTHAQSATCGYPFALGGSYLVYAYRHQDTGLLTTSICSRTSPLGLNADLKYLRGIKARESTALLKGEVTRRPANGRRQPLATTEVTLEALGGNDPRRYSALTGANGRFTVEAPTGRYKVSVALPPDLWMYDTGIALLDSSGCRELSIVAYPNGRIGGRVLDSRGTPVPFLPVDLMTPGDVRTRFATPISSAFTNEAGVFEIARVPPGTFGLGIHLSRSNGESANAFWFPAGPAASARTVTLGFGERISGRDVILPGDLAPVVVEGSVADPDGQPMANTTVVLSIDNGWSTYGVNSIPLDAAGRFKIGLIEGQRYRLGFSKAFAATYKRIDVPGLVASRGLPPIALRFER